MQKEAIERESLSVKRSDFLIWTASFLVVVVCNFPLTVYILHFCLGAVLGQMGLGLLLTLSGLVTILPLVVNAIIGFYYLRGGFFDKKILVLFGDSVFLSALVSAALPYLFLICFLLGFRLEYSLVFLGVAELVYFISLLIISSRNNFNGDI